MDFFRKLFGKLPPNEEQSQEKPPSLVTINNLEHNEFAEKFQKNGGVLIYCKDEDSFLKELEKIYQKMSENNKIGFIDKDLEDYFFQKIPKIQNDSNANMVLILNCESLLREDGGILFSSNQISESWIKNLPKELIILARTNQIVESKAKTLELINLLPQEERPHNIRSFHNFGNTEEFLTYKNPSKKVHLLLLEDSLKNT